MSTQKEIEKKISGISSDLSAIFFLLAVGLMLTLIWLPTYLVVKLLATSVLLSFFFGLLHDAHK